MEFEFSHRTRVRRHEAFAWLTDFTEDDHSGHRWGRGAHREIVSRTERRVEMRDAWRRRTIHLVVELDPPGAWHIRGRTRDAHWEASALLEDLPDGGCTLRVSYRIGGDGIGKLLLPLFRRRVEQLFERDWGLHVGDMEEQLGYTDG